MVAKIVLGSTKLCALSTEACPVHAKCGPDSKSAKFRRCQLCLARSEPQFEAKVRLNH